MRRSIYVGAGWLVAGTGVGVIVGKATAGDTGPPSPDTVCDLVAEGHFQRYSWNGDWDSDDPPPFPDAHWQPNVQGDPHGVGVAGAYFRSHGNSGGGDWFYLEWVEPVYDCYPVPTTVPTTEPPPTTVDPPTTTTVVPPPPTTVPDPCDTQTPPDNCSPNCFDNPLPRAGCIEEPPIITTAPPGLPPLRLTPPFTG